MVPFRRALPRHLQGRNHLGHEPPQRLVPREVAQPEDEAAAAGVHEGLGLLDDLVDRADQVVGQVAIGRGAAPQVTAAFGLDRRAHV